MQSRYADRIISNYKYKTMETSSGLSKDQLPLSEYFKEELRDIYGAEKQLAQALPKLRKAATSPDLSMAFEDHLSVTQNQISRLEQIFEILGEKAEAKKCEGMEGLLREGESVIHGHGNGKRYKRCWFNCIRTKSRTL